jgi:hypothetical protein
MGFAIAFDKGPKNVGFSALACRWRCGCSIVRTDDSAHPCSRQLSTIYRSLYLNNSGVICRATTCIGPISFRTQEARPLRSNKRTFPAVIGTAESCQIRHQNRSNGKGLTRAQIQTCAGAKSRSAERSKFRELSQVLRRTRRVRNESHPVLLRPKMFSALPTPLAGDRRFRVRPIPDSCSSAKRVIIRSPRPRWRAAMAAPRYRVPAPSAD